MRPGVPAFPVYSFNECFADFWVGRQAFFYRDDLTADAAAMSESLRKIREAYERC